MEATEDDSPNDLPEQKSDFQDDDKTEVHSQGGNSQNDMLEPKSDLQDVKMEATEDDSPNDLAEQKIDFQADDKNEVHSEGDDLQNDMSESKNDSQDDSKAEIQDSLVSYPINVQDVSLEEMEVDSQGSSKAESKVHSQLEDFAMNNSQERNKVDDDSQHDSLENGSQLDEDAIYETTSETESTTNATLYENSQFYVERNVEGSCSLITLFVESTINQQISGKTGETSLTENDFAKFRHGNLLNDSIIDAYLGLIKARSSAEALLPRVHAISSFFYKASTTDPKKVRRWVRQINLFEYDVVLFPISDGNHWATVVVDLKKKLVTYYDSLAFSDTKQGKEYANKYVQPVKNFIEAEALSRLNVENYFGNFKFCIQDEPLQNNAIDCGVFLCQFAKAYCQRHRLNGFSQSDMVDIRIHMMMELICNKLIDM